MKHVFGTQTLATRNNEKKISSEDNLKLSLIECYMSLRRLNIERQCVPSCNYMKVENGECFISAYLSIALSKVKDKIEVSLEADFNGEVVFKDKVDYDFSFNNFIAELDENSLEAIKSVLLNSMEKFKKYGNANLD